MNNETQKRMVKLLMKMYSNAEAKKVHEGRDAYIMYDMTEMEFKSPAQKLASIERQIEFYDALA